MPQRQEVETLRSRSSAVAKIGKLFGVSSSSSSASSTSSTNTTNIHASSSTVRSTPSSNATKVFSESYVSGQSQTFETATSRSFSNNSFDENSYSTSRSKSTNAYSNQATPLKSSGNSIHSSSSDQLPLSFGSMNLTGNNNNNSGEVPSPRSSSKTTSGSNQNLKSGNSSVRQSPTVSPRQSPSLQPISKKPNDIPTSSYTNLSRSNSVVSRSNSVNSHNNQLQQYPRFMIKEDGTHQHHLRVMKRQEKLSNMIKDLMGNKKLRNEMVSAVPNLLSSANLAALDQQAAAVVAAAAAASNNGSTTSLPTTNQPVTSAPSQSTITTASTDAMKPPTLFSSLIAQVNRGDITQFSGGQQQSLKQPITAVTVENIPINNDSNEVDNRSFVEKYGTCQEVIGRGTFGVVRVAHKRLSSNEEALFAVKEFKRKPTESDKKYSQRLINEFCISSSLKHLNIISTFDLLKDAKTDYCEVMEYCSGGDLYSLIIAAGKLEYCEADCFFKQLMRGVHYMHSMGVCHRDLKPENLLLTHNGILKITDFGNSECFKMAWEEHIQLSKGISGSSPYIAPEEYLQKEFDPRPLDIWSCGVIYMAMRTGRQLWKVADSNEDVFFKTYLGKRKDAKGYEPIESLKRARCRNVIYSILDPIPSRRLTAKQVLNSEWVREIKVCEAGDCKKLKLQQQQQQNEQNQKQRNGSI